MRKIKYSMPITAVVLSILMILSSVATISTSATTVSEFTEETSTDTLLLVDTLNDDVVFAQNADTRRAMASTTKIMTYIITAEHISDLTGTMIEITPQPINDLDGMGASMAGLANHIGESFSVLEILYGLMIPSGCDAAQVLAYYIGGDAEGFVEMMNTKAQELGCNDTHFADSHGISDDNYTTAEDLYKIAKYALDMPYFQEITGTEYYTLRGETTPYINTNYLIDEVNGGKYYYQYATGVKTGSTTLAGKCLVSTAKKGDKEYMCIALGGEYSSTDGYINHAIMDSKNLFQWAFQNFTQNIDISLDKRFCSVQLDDTVKLTATIGDNNTSETPIIKWSSSDESVATVDQNGVVTPKTMGQATIKATTQTGNFARCNLACGYYNGIDVTSRYGDYSSGEYLPVDWKAVKQYGFDFAIIRAGWGSEDYPNQNDKSFVYNVENAVANDIPFGVSFVAYAEDVEGAKAEAQYLIKELNEYIPDYKDKISLPIIYNMTDSQFKNFSIQQNTEIACVFNQAMKEAGYTTMCFANKTVFANMDIQQLRNNAMGVYYGYYPYEVNFSYEVKVNGTFTPDMWQYRTDGYIPEASEKLNTRQNLIYMLSSQKDKYIAPKITATFNDDKNVKLKWSEADYLVDSYSVYRTENNIDNYELIATLQPGVCEYTDVDITGGYTYLVKTNVMDLLNVSRTYSINSNYIVTPKFYDCDADSDGEITINDVTFIQKVLVKIISGADDDKPFADVNGDGDLDIRDATAIQRYLVCIN